MTVSWYGVRGGRSLPQSKYGLETTERGIDDAESLASAWSGLPRS